MTIRTLEIFAAVAEHGTMSAAARSLHISQSAVSQAVVDLERTYGVLLFERYAHTLHLTHIGQMLLTYARQTFQLSQETEAFLLNANRRSRLRVGASVTVGTTILCPLLDQLRKLYEGIDLEVAVSNTHDIEEKLINYELDVALVEGQVSHEDLIVETVIHDALVLVCGREHPFFGRTDVGLEELNGQTFLFREEGSATRAQLEKALKDNKVRYSVGWICNDPEIIQTATIFNFGITALSPLIVQENVKNGLLWSFSVAGLEVERRFSLVYHKNKYHAKAFDSFREICLAISTEESVN